MKKIGLTGGIGSGKTAILTHLQDNYGAVILVADEIAHLLEEPDMPCYNKLVGAFGEGILADDRNIDKRKMAEIIFKDKNALEICNSIIHPEVKKYILNRFEEEAKKGTGLLILEAALLIEDGYRDILDEIWYVYTNAENRKARLKASRGYSDEKIDSIMAKQLSHDEFLNSSDFVIDNNGSIDVALKIIDKYLGEHNE